MSQAEFWGHQAINPGTGAEIAAEGRLAARRPSVEKTRYAAAS
jgi:hypothetical protein